MIEKIDLLVCIWFSLVIFNVFFAIIESLAGLSNMLLVDALVLITKLLFEPSPTTFVIWLVGFFLYVKKKFID